MALCRCHHHRPEDSHHRTYTQPLAYLELHCTVEGCAQPVSIWLNPEEARDYERGSRLFYNDNFDVLKADSRGLSVARPVVRRPRIGFWFLRTRSAKRLSETQAKLET